MAGVFVYTHLLLNSFQNKNINQIKITRKMFKQLFLFILIISFYNSVHAQKKYINRKIAQKNYDGYMLMQDEKYDSALLIFNEALEADPEAFFIYQNRAICSLHLKDTLGAINDFKTNITMEPENADSRYALGNIFRQKKDTANTLKYYIPSLRVAKEDFSQKKLLYMSNFIGHFYRLNNKYDSALIYYNRVKTYTPKDASVFINSAVCNFGLDSIDRFCADLERAFVLGGDINCIALKAYCNGCNHLLEERGDTDTLSNALDQRLMGIIPDTVYYAYNYPTNHSFNVNKNKKIRIYYNELWQICNPENALYYREAYWSDIFNFFGGNYKDYYINDRIYAEGRIEQALSTGGYKSYYPNGNLKIKGQFVKGKPNGKWIYYLENGETDFEIDFFFEDYKFNIVNERNPNYILNTGTGKFKILLDKWKNIEFVLTGEYENNEREGKWEYTQDGQKLIWENYKKGKFKRGYVITNIGTLSTTSTRLDASVLIPPQITQVRNLYFDDVETLNYYPFISVSSF